MEEVKNGTYGRWVVNRSRAMGKKSRRSRKRKQRVGNGWHKSEK